MGRRGNCSWQSVNVRIRLAIEPLARPAGNTRAASGCAFVCACAQPNRRSSWREAGGITELKTCTCWPTAGCSATATRHCAGSTQQVAYIERRARRVAWPAKAENLLCDPRPENKECRPAAVQRSQHWRDFPQQFTGVLLPVPALSLQNQTLRSPSSISKTGPIGRQPCATHPGQSPAGADQAAHRTTARPGRLINSDRGWNV